MSKFEIQNPKSETNPKPEILMSKATSFRISNFENSSLFRVSCFEFRIFLYLLCIYLVGCSTSFDSRGIYHRVRERENLLWIAQSYGVDLQDTAELNNIQDINKKLEAGERIYIPPRRYHRHKKLPFEGKLSRYVEKEPRRDAKHSSRRSTEQIHTEHHRFLWPVQGTVLSGFGIRHGRRHDGIDIRAQQGTPIEAADSGRVVFAGTMRGYGNLILLRHADNFFTAYAHNKANLVKENQLVKRGTVIAKAGRTGRASGPHLHFEVREGDRARNPLFFLPVVR